MAKFKNLEIEMIKQDMTKQDLVNALASNGVTVTYMTVCRWLRGETEMKYGQALIISKILNKPADYLFSEG